MKNIKRVLLAALVLTIAVAVIWCAFPQLFGGGSAAPSFSLPSISGANSALPSGSLSDALSDAVSGALSGVLPSVQENAPDEKGSYTQKDEVALYLHVYGHLPGNFITKNEARALGWEGGGLDKFADGKSIGGDRFGNYEGQLPDKNGRVWYECDIGTMHKNERGAKRIVFSNDGLIYYTADHYDSFTQLY